MEIIILLSVVLPMLLVAGLFIVIWKTDWMYDRTRGGWKPGISLPHLLGNEGDEIDHEGYKRFIGITGFIYILIFTLLTIVPFIGVIDFDKYNEDTIAIIITVIVLLSTGLLIFLLYGPYKEKYIKRVNSIPPTYHRYVYVLILVISITSMLGIYLETVKVLPAGVGALLIILSTMIASFIYVFKMFNYFNKHEYYSRLGHDITKWKSFAIKILGLSFGLSLVAIVLEYIKLLSPGLISIITLILLTIILTYMFIKLFKIYKEANEKNK